MKSLFCPLVAVVALAAGSAFAQSGSPQIAWQRTFEDAIALSKANGKPLLVCVNVDGETASERLATRRYQDAGFVERTRRFVAVIASPDRHTESDYDEHGHRVECPKFGRVTCSEHIDIEPKLYAAFFDGQRVAPRHIGVSESGKTLFDIYLTNNLDLINDALAEHGTIVAPRPRIEDVRKLVDSHDAGDRSRTERAYRNAAEDLRLWLAERAAGNVPHPEIVRLGLRDPSAQVRRAAAGSLARIADGSLLDMFHRAFDAIGEHPATEQELLAGLARLSESADDAAEERASYLHRVYTGLTTPSKSIDVDAWHQRIAAGTKLEPALREEELEELDDELDRLGKQLRQRRDDGALHLAIAAGNLRYARIRMIQGQDPRFLLEDARSAAQRALQHGGDTGRAHGIAAWTAHLLGDAEQAEEHSAKAVPALANRAETSLAAEVVGVFAQTRLTKLYAAFGDSGEWSPEMLADIHAAYRVLQRHPIGTEQHAIAHLGLLDYLAADSELRGAIDAALGRFPASVAVHEKLRQQLLRDGGPDRLEEFYRQRIERPEGEPMYRWLFGFASLLAAESRARNGDAEAAAESYSNAVRQFGACGELEPGYADNAAHYAALALAGRARLETEAKRFDRAVADAVAALEIRAACASLKDGLDKTPLESARALRALLRQAQRDDLLKRLQHAIESISAAAR